MKPAPNALQHEHVRAKRIVAASGVRIGEPDDRTWCLRDFTLFDPGRALSRVALNIPSR